MRANPTEKEYDITFGTSNVFKKGAADTVSIADSLGKTHDVLPGTNAKDDPENYNFYFSSATEAQKGPDVKANVTKIVY